ncbi:MAG: IS3 family transposase [Fusobacteriaceae bacterium]
MKGHFKKGNGYIFETNKIISAIIKFEFIQVHYKVHIDSKRAYGSPRIATALNANGHIASKRLVAKLMKQNSIHAISHKKFRAKVSPSKDSIEQNLIKDVVVTAPNQVRVTDITYIWTKKRWMYLSSIMVLYSRKIISHIINYRMVEDTLNLALSRRNWTKGLICIVIKNHNIELKLLKTLKKIIILNNPCVEKEIAMIIQQWSFFILV